MKFNNQTTKNAFPPSNMEVQKSMEKSTELLSIIDNLSVVFYNFSDNPSKEVQTLWMHKQNNFEFLRVLSF